MTPSEILAIKEKVRARDGYRCVECGMANDEHLERYGSVLEVHRLVPGSPYAYDESCVTLCIPCHGPKPRRPRGQRYVDEGILLLSPGLHHEAKIVAAYRGASLSCYLSEVLKPLVEQHHAEHVAQAANCTKPKKDKPSGKE